MARASASPAAETAVERARLAVGAPVRYQGFGSGRVLRVGPGELAGEACTLAVIRLWPGEMTVKLPLERADEKLKPVSSTAEIARLLALIDDEGEPLADSWPDRERAGKRRLRKGGPTDWASLLRDYATAVRTGLGICGSDRELVRAAIELLAAEYAASTGLSFEDAASAVNAIFGRAAR